MSVNPSIGRQLYNGNSSGCLSQFTEAQRWLAKAPPNIMYETEAPSVIEINQSKYRRHGYPENRECAVSPILLVSATTFAIRALDGSWLVSNVGINFWP